MGVYIKDMEMPKGEDFAIAVIYSDGTVINKRDNTTFQSVPVPTPHGRLVDIDAEIERHDCVPILGEHLKLMANHMTTVIESEE